MRISDWSSDVCSSDLKATCRGGAQQQGAPTAQGLAERNPAVDGEQNEIADQAVGVAIAEAMALNGLNRETRKKRHDDAAKQRRRPAIAASGPAHEQTQPPKTQKLHTPHTDTENGSTYMKEK